MLEGGGVAGEGIEGPRAPRAASRHRRTRLGEDGGEDAPRARKEVAATERGRPHACRKALRREDIYPVEGGVAKQYLRGLFLSVRSMIDNSTKIAWLLPPFWMWYGNI